LGPRRPRKTRCQRQRHRRYCHRRRRYRRRCRASTTPRHQDLKTKAGTPGPQNRRLNTTASTPQGTAA
ncbi:MAG: hypothetical protein ACK56I_29590, partial [bacterium]